MPLAAHASSPPSLALPIRHGHALARSYLHTMKICQLNIAIFVQVQHLKEIGDDVDSVHEDVAQLVQHAFTEAAAAL